MPKPPTELPDHQVTPNPKLEKRTRRQFSTEYKLRILAEADACRHGEFGELLRREKLYSSQLTTWRKELAQDGEEKLHKTAPGPKASKTPEQKRIEALEQENSKLQQKLSAAEDCLSLQKKALSMLDRMSNGSER
ncbi:transposase [Halomonas sp. 25-S5]|uniref:transposase n=1 Tax=Halomonas sp. 25-S5 TaxID=2994065 RepID=UPI00246871AD|nr:transposase [Halomonas sp. 25-S5]